MDINSNKSIENLKKTALDAPTVPGVYLMKNDDGGIIYIGKAKNLRNRLKSYFSGEKDPKTATLMKHVRNLETIIVASEFEAFLLENTLIKQHSPKYNINLKDGKTYPVIRVTHEDFPRVHRTRRIIQDNSLYFGPFPNSNSVITMLEIIDKLFPLRKCKRLRKSGPCMYYHINRCKAPCRKKISVEDYNVSVDHVKKLLSGETASLIIDLTAQMHERARELKFEQAAELRNAIKALENLSGEESIVEDMNPENRDYIAWASEGVLATFTVFSMRGGKMTGRDLFRTRSAAAEWDSLELFITSYYDSARPPPRKIYFQTLVANDLTQRHQECSKNNNSTTEFHGEKDKKLIKTPCNSVTSVVIYSIELLSNWFKEKFNHVPELIIPNDKHHTAILAMARQNAAEDIRKRLKERGAGPALEELARVLNLQTKPERIEGFDISHLDGKYPTASLVSFKNGVPDRKNYRHFKLRSVIGKADDYAAMREVVRRRYSRLLREGIELPDLVLVDGGIGQVSAAKEVFNELGVDCALAGLAEKKEEVWLPGAKEPVVISHQSDSLKLLQFIRDESHRFANNLNRKLRSKDFFFPTLESVEGIGPKRAAVIMKEYESIANIAAAGVQEMAKRCKISEASARAVRACAKLALSDQLTTNN